MLVKEKGMTSTGFYIDHVRYLRLYCIFVYRSCSQLIIDHKTPLINKLALGVVLSTCVTHIVLHLPIYLKLLYQQNEDNREDNKIPLDYD